jgi:hypothetical protein
MIDELGRVVWRVRAQNGAETAGAFDALVVPTVASGLTGGGKSAQHLAMSVPYEGELPDAPFTLVVRARPDAGTLLVECEALAPDGTRRIYGRSTHPLAVIVRSATGILVTGLPGAV